MPKSSKTNSMIIHIPPDAQQYFKNPNDKHRITDGFNYLAERYTDQLLGVNTKDHNKPSKRGGRKKSVRRKKSTRKRR